MEACNNFNSSGCQGKRGKPPTWVWHSSYDLTSELSLPYLVVQLHSQQFLLLIEIYLLYS